MDKDKIGLFIKKLREDKGFSKRELAGKVGCTEYDFTVWESGYMLPESRYLLNLAKALDISVEELLSGELNPGSDENPIAANDIAPQGQAESAGKTEKAVSADGSKAQYAKNTGTFEMPAKARAVRENTPENEPADEGGNNVQSANSQTAYGVKYSAERTANRHKARPEKKYSFKDAYTKRLNSDGYIPDQSGDRLVVPDIRNGFSAKERKIGYIVGCIFLIILALSTISSVVSYINRDREITLGNYREYITIDIRAVSNVNNDEYIVKITADKDFANLNAKIAVRFTNYFGNHSEITKTVEFSGVSLNKGGSEERRIKLENYMYRNSSITVEKISGDLY